MEDQVVTEGCTELKNMADSVNKMLGRLAALENSRQEFVSNVSHELKTPLTAISGYAELIENNMVDEKKQIKFAGDIKKNADRLVSLINDIIRLSELDHSETKVDFSEQDIYEVALERVELLRDVAIRKGVELSLEGKETKLLSNRGMLVELLDNLIQILFPDQLQEYQFLYHLQLILLFHPSYLLQHLLSHLKHCIVLHFE